MSSTPKIREIIEDFSTLIQAAESLLAEENGLLKQGHGHTSSTLLDQKRVLIAELDSLLEATRARSEEATPEEKSHISRLQARLMKLLVLDRENERMLLQSTLPQRPAPPGNPMRMARTYHQHQRVHS